MITYLLEAGSKITEISDLLTSKWAEILGWISIPTVVSAIIVCLFKLITAGLSKKIAAKNVKPIVEEVKKAKEIFTETAKNLEDKFNSKLLEYEDAVKCGIQSGFAAYEEKKTEVYAEILNADEKIKEMVGEVKPKVIDVVENYNQTIEEIKQIAEEKADEKIDPNPTEKVATKPEKKNKKTNEEIDPFAR